jgi:TP901 family phage tail tape measure protein
MNHPNEEVACMADGSIIIDTKIDQSGLESGLTSIKSGVKGAADLAVVGIAAATAALTVAAGAVVSLGTEYEHTMATAATLFGDVNVDVYSLDDKILALSSDTGIAAADLGDALYDALSSGIPVTEDMEAATDYLAKSSKLAVAGLTDVKTASGATAKVLNAYKMGIEDTDRVQKVLMATQNRGITTVDELSSVLAQVTPTAAAMNVSFEQVGAALATMTAQGTPAAQATTQLNGLFAELGKSGTVAQKSLEAAAEGTKYAGMSFQDMMDAGVPLNEVIDLMGGYADKSGLSLLDMFSSLEAGKAALAVSGENAATFSSNLEYMSTSADLVGDAYDTLMDTLEGQTSQLKESAKNLGISIYNGMSGKLKDVAKLGNAYITTLSGAFEKGGMTGLVGALGSVLGDALSKASEFAPQMIDMAVELLDSLVEGISDNADVIAEGLADTLEAALLGLVRIIPSMLSAGIKIATKLISAIADSLPELIPQIIDALVGGLVLLVSNVPMLLEVGAKLVTGVLGGVLSAIPNMISSIASLFVFPAPDMSKVSAATQEVIDKAAAAKLATEQITTDLDQNVTDANSTYTVAENWLSIIDQLKQRKTLTSEDWALYTQAIETLNGLYPGLNLEVGENTGLIDLNTTAIRNQITAFRDVAIAQAYKNAIQELSDTLVDEQLNLATATSDFNTKMEAQKGILDTYALAYQTYGTTFGDVIKASQNLPTGDVAASVDLATRALQDNAGAILALLPDMMQYYTIAEDGTAKLKPGVDAMELFGDTYDNLGGVLEQTNTQLLQSYTETDKLKIAMAEAAAVLNDTQATYDEKVTALNKLAEASTAANGAITAEGDAAVTAGDRTSQAAQQFELAGVGILNGASNMIEGSKQFKTAAGTLDDTTTSADESAAALQLAGDDVVATKDAILATAEDIKKAEKAATDAETTIDGVAKSISEDAAASMETMLKLEGDIATHAQALMDAMKQTYTNNLDGVAQAGADVAQETVDRVSEILTTEAAKTIAQAYVDSISTTITNSIATVSAAGTSIAQATTDNVAAILTYAAGKSITTSYISGIKNGLSPSRSGGSQNHNGGNNEVTSAAAVVANSALAKFTSILTNAAGYSIGYSITSGIAGGILAGRSAAVNAAIYVAEATLKAVKDRLEMRSPSHVFRDEVGANISEGIAVGILGSETSVLSAMDKLSTDMQSADLTASMRAAVLMQNDAVSGKTADAQAEAIISTANDKAAATEDAKIDYYELARAIREGTPTTYELVDANGTYIGTLAEPTVSEIQSRKLQSRKKV